eukprot:875726-Rhodomonas_salina.2
MTCPRPIEERSRTGMRLTCSELGLGRTGLGARSWAFRGVCSLSRRGVWVCGCGSGGCVCVSAAWLCLVDGEKGTRGERAWLFGC